ncbi:MAG: MATE family efflux transporter [Bradyrhizobium sp.]|nr:MAG: MATE family efflux transporter [Bradyrhizobium sp.]
MRHVAVMTATGSIGLVAVFAVDFLSLFWVARLGSQSLKAAVGYATQLQFIALSVSIGLTIAISATVSRALGAGNRDRARRLAASGLAIATAIATALAIVMVLLRDPALTFLLHAKGEPAEVASRFLLIAMPANIAFSLAMAFTGALRAVGDARRAMYVTLSGGVITAFTDPLLIFGFGLGVYGAAWAIVISRLVMLAVGINGAIRVHNMVARPTLAAIRADFAPVMGIGVPAILANLAMPVGALYVTRAWSDFGVDAVTGGAVIDRVIPLAFGVVFALTGSIGPILGQNFGARLMDRVQRAYADALILSVSYALLAWAVLAIAGPAIAAMFDVTGDAASFVVFFCRYGVSAWLFITCLFVANTVFNNLGQPILATLFNWGRATLGTVPCVILGARWGGVEGAIIGIGVGAAIFGLAATGLGFVVVGRLARTVRPK